ncbi:MAG: outer membrane protein assembly factor BamB family protein [Planctomycetota bacterium]
MRKLGTPERKFKNVALECVVKVVFILLIAVSVYAGPNDWTHYGHFATRQSIAVEGPNIIDGSTLEWVADEDPQDPNYGILFETATGVVVYNDLVYGYSKYYNEIGEYTNSQIVAYDANSGELEWATYIDQAVWESWSTTCIDTKHNWILIGSGDKVFALDTKVGTIDWTTSLEKNIVNASVCAALDIPAARAFINDYDGFGSTGKLYCINLDPNESGNPYDPGDIVWSVTLGATSGNSPAYKDGVVYIGCLAGTSTGYGTIYAYDATAEPESIKLWETSDPNFDGFFGGVTVTNEDFLYAANYNWADEIEDNSKLCKIDCNDGNIVWMTDTERTSCIPVVVGDKIYISGGVDGYGSRPKVEAYQDLGNNAVKLWETDSDMAVGGWTAQPVYANRKLYVGANDLGTYTDLYILDVNFTPDDPGFIIDTYSGAGNSPTVTYDSIYTIGYDDVSGHDRLLKFKQFAFLADIKKDSLVDSNDLDMMIDSWLYTGPMGVDRSDLNLDGVVNLLDFGLLANEWSGP